MIKSLFSPKRLLILGLFALLALCMVPGAQAAATDITSAVSEVSGYWDAVKVIAIGVMLFVIGRKVFKKL